MQFQDNIYLLTIIYPLECDAGSYGQGCSMTCGDCRDGAPCDSVNGTCPDGCSVGRRGDKCDVCESYIQFHICDTYLIEDSLSRFSLNASF
jgi:hypothetical protein